MTSYYNEIDPKAAAWLRELINRNLIASGDVDERSIEDVTPSDLKSYTQCHFFAGIGVWSYALRQSGWSDERQVWTGSCPCQPFSSAGKQRGTEDSRHLWPVFYRLIKECRPDTVFGEQVAGKAGLSWLDLVSTDLESSDYAVGSAVTAACGFGSPHIRKRLYWVADAVCQGLSLRKQEELSGAIGDQEGRATEQPCGSFDWLPCGDGKTRPIEPGLSPLADGAPARVVRLRGYGNAIQAQQAQAFIESYMETIA